MPQAPRGAGGMERHQSILAGRYRVYEVLGEGGMARVFRAEDTRLHRMVAIKVLHEQYRGQPEFVRRFEHEAQVAGSLSHPHIVSIYDVGDVSVQSWGKAEQVW